MNKRFKTVSFVLLLMGLPVMTAQATNTTIETIEIVQQNDAAQGIVVDANGEPLTGASVIIKGTTKGTMVDNSGRFTIPGVKAGQTLRITFIGYTPMEVKWEGQPLRLTLKEDNNALDEVVIVGYGTQKKVNLTGSVSMIGADVLDSRPVTSTQQALQGVIPGLNLGVTGDGGALDGSMSMNIRGVGSIGEGSSAAPLILIDGIEGDLNSVNPNDIENISVLKDAASASIYGARASFGVILVTTKNGSKGTGKAHVTYSGNVRFNSPTDLPQMMNSLEFANYFNTCAANNGQAPVFDQETLKRIEDYYYGRISTTTVPTNDGTRWETYGRANSNTDWFQEFYKDFATSHEHNVTISGGTDRVNYRVSGSFLRQNGLIDYGRDNMKRYTMDGKISAKLADWVTLNYATKWTRNDYLRPTYMSGLFFHNIPRRWPVSPVLDPNGHLMEGMEILQLSEGGEQTQKKNYYTQQVGFVFEPIKDWHINVEGSLRTYNYNQHWAVLPTTAYDPNNEPFLVSWDGGAAYTPGQTRVYEYRFTEDYYTTNIYTDYSWSINDAHNFKVMAGFNGELTKNNNISAQADGLNSATTPYLGQTTTMQRVSGGANHYAVAGFFARINYNYKDRYMVELNGRYDGSSRFLADKRWGFFPSFSAGWNIAREDFFKPLADKIQTLKLRGSWGQLGNTNTNSLYPFYQIMSTGAGNGSWLINGSKPNTASMPGIVSTLMTWETVESWDLGLDLACFNNRLTLSADYFQRKTLDMVGPAPVLPSVLGTNAPRINNCDMKSKGWELEIMWRDKVGEFGYSAKLLLSDSQATITDYPNKDKALNTYYNGRKYGEIWGYETEGIAQSQEQMDAWLQNNRPTWGSNWSAGDVMYRDLNGDGKVNSGDNTLENHGDLVVIGNNTPRYNFGINVTADWKGFDFSMFWQGTAKRDFWTDSAFFWGGGFAGMWQCPAFKEHLDYWSADNPNAYYPRPCFGGSSKNRQTQTRYLQNAAYIRLKNIQLGYTLPQQVTEKAKISKLRVYVSADNLLTFSQMGGMFDPENLNSNYDGSAGKAYPLQKVISVGLNVNF